MCGCVARQRHPAPARAGALVAVVGRSAHAGRWCAVALAAGVPVRACGPDAQGRCQRGAGALLAGAMMRVFADKLATKERAERAQRATKEPAKRGVYGGCTHGVRCLCRRCGGCGGVSLSAALLLPDIR